MSTGRGKVVVISGPSGSGKTSIIHRLRVHPRVTVSVSVTTRPPRADETDGQDYRFVDRETFLAMKDGGEFIETNDVFGAGHMYGSVRADLEEVTAQPGRVYIMEVDVVGARNLIDRLGSASRPLYIFIKPPDLAELERRLRQRNTDSDEDIAKRLDRARAEIAQARKDRAALVVNNELDTAVREIESLIGLDANATV